MPYPLTGARVGASSGGETGWERACAISTRTARCSVMFGPFLSANGVVASAGVVGDDEWTMGHPGTRNYTHLSLSELRGLANQLLASPHHSRSVHPPEIGTPSRRRLAKLCCLLLLRTSYHPTTTPSAYIILGSSSRLQSCLISPSSRTLRQVKTRGLFPYNVWIVQRYQTSPTKLVSPRNQGIPHRKEPGRACLPSRRGESNPLSQTERLPGQ